MAGSEVFPNQSDCQYLHQKVYQYRNSYAFMKVMQLFILLILFTALMPISIGEKQLDFDIELKGVEIYQYATFNMTLTKNPVSVNDLSAFDIGYRTDREMLGKLRDFLCEKSKSENSPILKISPVEGEIDELIEIELKDGTIIYLNLPLFS